MDVSFAERKQASQVAVFSRNFDESWSRLSLKKLHQVNERTIVMYLREQAIFTLLVLMPTVALSAASDYPPCDPNVLRDSIVIFEEVEHSSQGGCATIGNLFPGSAQTKCYVFPIDQMGMVTDEMKKADETFEAMIVRTPNPSILSNHSYFVDGLDKPLSPRIFITIDEAGN